MAQAAEGGARQEDLAHRDFRAHNWIERCNAAATTATHLLALRSYAHGEGEEMKGWSKIEEGWYLHTTGAIVQRWWRAAGSPMHKAGWYVWPKSGELARGSPFKTRDEAMREALKTR